MYRHFKQIAGDILANPLDHDAPFKSSVKPNSIDAFPNLPGRLLIPNGPEVRKRLLSILLKIKPTQGFIVMRREI
jgi:hypothetical protein